MKSRDNFLYSIFVLIFFGLSVFLAFRSKKYNNFLNETKIELIIQNQKSQDYNKRSKMKMFMDSEELQPVFLLNSTNDSIPIQDLVITPKLIFRFPNQFCPPCIESALTSLKNLGDSIGHNNIIVISDCKNSRILKILIDMNSILSPCFSYSGQLNFEIEGKLGSDRKPYYMILNQELKVSFPFFAEENDELNSIYLSRIRKLFDDEQW